MYTIYHKIFEVTYKTELEEVIRSNGNSTGNPMDCHLMNIT